MKKNLQTIRLLSIIIGCIVFFAQCQQDDVNLEYSEEYSIPSLEESMNSFVNYNPNF